MKICMIFRENVNEPLKAHIFDTDSVSITIVSEAILIRDANGSHKSYNRYQDGFIKIKAVENTGD